MSNQEKPEPMDLMFEKSGRGRWTSRNNNYVIVRNGRRDFSVHAFGVVTNGFGSVEDCEEWAGIDQAKRLGRC